MIETIQALGFTGTIQAIGWEPFAIWIAVPIAFWLRD